MSKRLVVIGDGVVGRCVAYYCAQAGWKVRVLERGAADHDGCSFGNAGMVVPSHFIPLAAPGVPAMALRWMFDPASPFYIRPRLSFELLRWGWDFYRACTPARVQRAALLLRDIGLMSRRLFDELAEKLGDFSFTRRGLLMLCKSRETLAEEEAVAEWAKQLGISARVLNAGEVAEVDPAVKMDVAGAVHFEQDGHLVPREFMAVLRKGCEELGVNFEYGVEVTGWRASGYRIEGLATMQGDVEGDEYIICGGMWSQNVAAEIGLRVPMQAGKGYSLTVPEPPKVPQLCSILTEARVAVTPMGNAVRFGGTMEMAGLNESVTRKRVEQIIRAVPRYFPEYSPEMFESIEPWRGMRPCSPDGLPYIGRFGRFENLLAATGHAMLGLSLGPATGKLVADLLCDRETAIDWALLSPERYA